MSDQHQRYVPSENDKLRLTVVDLTRRLKNAHHTIEAERKISKNALSQANLYRMKLIELTNILKLETSKLFNYEKKELELSEIGKYNTLKEKSTQLHNELRNLEVDHLITRYKTVPLKLVKLRKKVELIESQQDSQHKYLQEISEYDKLNESLSLAAQLGNLEECYTLLSSGAWVNYIDSAGYLAIHYACSTGCYEVVKLLLEFGSDHSSFLTGYSCIVIAATYGYIDIIELLINFGADVEDKGRSRNPPVIAALEGGHLEVFEYLVDQIGADVNSTNCDENTCLHIAVNLKVESVSYQLQIIHSIIDRGINQTRVNRKGLTALQLALLNHNRIISQELGARFSDGDGEVILTEDLLQNMPISFTNPNVGEQANYLSMTTSSVMYKKTSEAMINNLSKKTTASSQGNGCSTSIRANNESIVVRAKAASTITIDSRKSSIPLIQRTDLIQRTVDPMSSTVAPTRTIQKFTSKFRRQVAGEQVLPATNPLVIINPSSQLKESVDSVMKAEEEQQMKDGNVTVDRLKAGGGKSIIDRNLNSMDHHHHHHQLVGEEDGSLFTEVHMVDDKVVVLTNDAAAATTNKLTTRNYKMKQVDTSVESNNKDNNLVFSMDSIQLLEKGEGASMSSPPPDSSTPQAAVSVSAADQKEHEVNNNNSNIRKKQQQQLFPRSSGRDIIGRGLRVDDSLIDDSSMSIISGVTFDNQ